MLYVALKCFWAICSHVVYRSFSVHSLAACTMVCKLAIAYLGFLNMQQCCSIRLASVPDGYIRQTVSQGAESKRIQQTLEPVPWFCQLLQQYGGPDFHERVLRRLAGKRMFDQEGVQIDGLLRVSARGCTYEQGALTNWSREDLLQKKFYGEPLDAYTLHVGQAFRCVEPPTIYHKAVRGLGSGGVGQIQKSHPLFIAHWGPSEADGSAKSAMLETRAGLLSARQVLSGLGDDTNAEELRVLVLPWPLAFLVVRGAWPRLLVLLRWHSALHQHRHRKPLGPIEDWPPHDADIWNQRKQDKATSHMQDDLLLAQKQPLTAEALEGFAQVIQPRLIPSRLI